jgi:hypothetical protein
MELYVVVLVPDLPLLISVSSLTTLQPSHLAHTRPASNLVWTVHGAFYVP